MIHQKLVVGSDSKIAATKGDKWMNMGGIIKLMNKQ